MPIPMSISKIIETDIVEHARIEYKEGWNPESVLHTICAFANDIDNWGGGYIVVGAEEQNGCIKRPLKGIDPQKLDGIQKELLNLCHRLQPEYMPVCEPLEYEGVWLLLIWVPGGYDRPYKAPVFPKNKGSEKAFYVRRFSSTVKASSAEEQELHDLGGRIPFDDRINYQASLKDIRLSYMEEYLRSIGSVALETVPDSSVLDIAKSLRVVRGPKEDIRPVNVGLMMFSPDPERFFPYARIEVVDIPDPTGEGMSEHIFRGPLDRQLSDALSFIKNYVIAERVFKLPGQAEALRVYNYPYEAIEEALSNAVLHRSYMVYEPITVRIEKDRISILSLPGPDRSISDEDISRNVLVSKRYRNRRIGEFLKELDLIEGRNTGIPTMIRALQANGSEPPIFLTDADRTFFEVVFKINEKFANVDNEDIPVSSSHNVLQQDLVAGKRRSRSQLRDEAILQLSQSDLSKTELGNRMGYKGRNKTLNQVVDGLISEGLVELTGPQFAPTTKLHLVD